jgi:hypothetical protein
VFHCFIMASSRPSALVLDDEDDWGSFSPPVSQSSRISAPSSSRSSAPSGEYNAFALVGSVIAGGGGSSVSYGAMRWIN